MSLIQELMELGDSGVKTFDASINQTFKMHIALMWTISDIPRLGNLSRWNMYTGLACLFATLISSLNIYPIVRNHASCVIIVTWTKAINLSSTNFNLMLS